MDAAFFAAGVLTTLALATGVGADHGCNGDLLDLGGVLYIDERGSATGDVSIWVYLESNDTPGLQSGGVGALDPVGQASGLFSQADACAHPDPDTLIL